LVKKVCSYSGQHHNNFSIGHDKKECCKGSIVDELTRGSKLERPTTIATKSQPKGCSYHTTFANRTAKLGRHEEEGLRVGNRKFQLLKQVIGSLQMPY
jgi:hypothetical protein